MQPTTDRRRFERTYTEPRSLEEARRRRDDLTTAVIEIEGQLARRDRKDETGARMTPKQYGAWRDRAIEAKTVKTNEIRYLKRWIADHREDRRAPVLPADLAAASWSPALNRAYYETIGGALREQLDRAARESATLQAVRTMLEQGSHVGDVLLAALLQAESLIQDFQRREVERLANSAPATWTEGNRNA